MSLATKLAFIPNITLNYIPRATATGFVNGVIYDNGTNVGIGTSSPSNILELKAVSSTNSIVLGSIASTGGYNMISLNGTNAEGQYIGIAGGGNTDKALYYQSGNAGSHIFRTGDGTNFIERLRITSAGNVGIGTSSPTGLSVATNLIVKGATDKNGYIQALSGDGASSVALYSGSYSGDNPSLIFQNSLRFGTATDSGTNAYTERMRITSGGNVILGYSSWSIDTHYIGKGTNQGDFIVYLGGSGARYGNTATFQTVDYQGWNGAAAGLKVGWNSGNSRSINTYGTINTGGSDYAEYMQKETDDENKKGDIVGVNANGKLTNIFNDAVSFVVKSTNPSFVGGDTWGSDIDDDDILETERHKVDRIAFSGQVPCNVLGANVGDYIIPVEKNGKIIGQAVTNPTFEQYQLSVGKVWKIMEDGRAWIAVKIG